VSRGGDIRDRWSPPSAGWLLSGLLAVFLFGAGILGCGSDGSGGGSDGSANHTGTGGTGGGAGGFVGRDGGLPDAFNLDGLNLDAILADAGITTCAAGVANGSPCASGVDTGCLPASGGSFCFCQNAGTWSCF
jgi:hypothetical protein